MWTLIIFVTFFVLPSVFCQNLQSIDSNLTPIEARFCNEHVTKHYIRNLDLGIGPQPALVKKGEHVHVRFGVDLMKRYPPGPFTNVTIKMELSHLGMKIPCFHIDIVSRFLNVPRR